MESSKITHALHLVKTFCKKQGQQRHVEAVEILRKAIEESRCASCVCDCVLEDFVEREDGFTVSRCDKYRS